MRDGSWVTTKYQDLMNATDPSSVVDMKVWVSASRWPCLQAQMGDGFLLLLSLMHNPLCVLQERRPIFCVPVPGQSAWVQEATAHMKQQRASEGQRPCWPQCKHGMPLRTPDVPRHPP